MDHNNSAGLIDIAQALPAHLGLIKGRHGLFLYLRGDRYVGRSLELYGEFSQSEAMLFSQILGPGQVVIEAGSNIGAHTVGLSRLVGPEGRIHAFEPQTTLFTILAANVALNGLGNVDLFRMGLGERPGILKLPRIDYSCSDNFGAYALSEDGTDEVSIATIDSRNFPRADFVKIDVEGMEAAVLEGARRTIGKFRPVLYVENDRTEKSPQLIRLLWELGYKLWWDFAPLYRPDNFFGEVRDEFPSLVSANLLAFPQEREIVVEREPVTDAYANWFEIVNRMARR